MKLTLRTLKDGTKMFYGTFTAPDLERPGKRKRYVRALGTSNRSEAEMLLTQISKQMNDPQFDVLRPNQHSPSVQELLNRFNTPDLMEIMKVLRRPGIMGLVHLINQAYDSADRSVKSKVEIAAGMAAAEQLLGHPAPKRR